MPSLAQLRRRTRPIVALLMLLVALTAVGLACACSSDHPMQAIERSIAGAATAVTIPVPVVLELWALALVAVMASATLVNPQRWGFGRASPAALQRFRL